MLSMLMTDSQFEFAPLRLKKKEERRIKQGHPWVYSNEVDTAATPLKALEPGQPVVIEDQNGKALGTGYANPRSLICARLVSRDPRYPFSPSLLVHRLKIALSLREKLYSRPYYRLVHGEGDNLPGLIVDRYDDVLVVQTTTAGMEAQREHLLEALNKVLNPKTIMLRNEGPIRALEGLESYSELVQGDAEDHITILEGDAIFHAPFLEGQKTGWFYDQRDNRRELQRLAPGARVLDVCSYVGGWGIQSAVNGAQSAICVDESARAGEYVRENARVNNLDNVDFIQGDAFNVLKSLHQSGEKFDLIIVDPPAFIKKKKDHRKGLEAYRRINQMAMQLMEREGFLVACSCSYHLQREELVHQLALGSRHIERNLQVLSYGQQSADHPVHPMIPETAYLKAVYTRVTK